MATWRTPSPLSQSASARRSAVIVPKVRVWTSAAPPGAARRTQTTTVFLWTSNPAQRSRKMSMGPPVRWRRLAPGDDLGAGGQLALRAARRAGDDRVGLDMESSRGQARFVLGLGSTGPTSGLGPGGTSSLRVAEPATIFMASGDLSYGHDDSFGETGAGASGETAAPRARPHAR